MERKIVSFKEFKEILCNIGLNTYETERFVHELTNAVEVYCDYFLFYEEKAISMDLIQNEATIDCDIVCKGTRIEIAFNYSIREEIFEFYQNENWQKMYGRNN